MPQGGLTSPLCRTPHPRTPGKQRQRDSTRCSPRRGTSEGWWNQGGSSILVGSTEGRNTCRQWKRWSWGHPQAHTMDYIALKSVPPPPHKCPPDIFLGWDWSTLQDRNTPGYRGPSKRGWRDRWCSRRFQQGIKGARLQLGGNNTPGGNRPCNCT